MVTWSPGLWAVMRSTSWLALPTALPSTAVMMSPVFNPAAAAGLPFATLVT